MSGHNKWSKIKHIKAKTDAQKGKVFSKMAREITVAVKASGADPEMNPALRLAIRKAKDVNMPNDNINRAIEKGAGAGDGSDLEEITYEAYGPNGVAMLIQTVTDNKNRTVPSLRTIVSKAGGSMASVGAVSYLFEKKGLFLFETGDCDEKIIDIATESGAEDIDVQSDGSIEVKTSIEEFETVQKAFDGAEIPYLNAELTQIPKTVVNLDESSAIKTIRLIENLENDDDVQNVYANYVIDDEILDRILEA